MTSSTVSEILPKGLYLELTSTTQDNPNLHEQEEKVRGLKREFHLTADASDLDHGTEVFLPCYNTKLLGCIWLGGPDILQAIY